MNYQELVQEFIKETGLEFEDAAEFVDNFFSIIKLNLSNRERVILQKLGVFSPRPIRTRILKNLTLNRNEIQAYEFYPHFKSTKVKSKPKAKTAPSFNIKEIKKKDAEKIEVKPIPQTEEIKKVVASKEPKPAPAIQIEEIEKVSENVKPKKIKETDFPLNTTKVLVYITILFLLLSGFIYFEFNYFKDKILKEKINQEIENYLVEQGLSSMAIQELISNKYQEVMNKTDEYNKELAATLSTQLQRIKQQQELSFEKLTVVEQKLKTRISKMIKPQLIKRKKNAEIKIILYEVKKNDTLWSLSKRYMNNPYNWVGLYKNNGEKIKDPDKIYPGQKILIPSIKEY